MNRKLQVTESRIKQKEENVRLLFYKKFTFVRVLCASAVRVGVCGGVCVCLGALKKKKKIGLPSSCHRPQGAARLWAVSGLGGEGTLWG